MLLYSSGHPEGPGAAAPSNFRRNNTNSFSNAHSALDFITLLTPHKEFQNIFHCLCNVSTLSLMLGVELYVLQLLVVDVVFNLAI